MCCINQKNKLKVNRRVIFLFMLVFICFSLFAQSEKMVVQGYVTDAARDPLPGVTITVKGTSDGVLMLTENILLLYQRMLFSFLAMWDLSIRKSLLLVVRFLM